MASTVLVHAADQRRRRAGIQADLKTFAALGVYGMAAITALTAQNTVAVTGVHEVPPEFVAAQIDAVFADIVPDAVKTGMLSSAAIIHVVAEKARAFGFQNLVVDPVMVAKSGDRLLHEDAVRALRRDDPARLRRHAESAGSGRDHRPPRRDAGRHARSRARDPRPRRETSSSRAATSPATS